MKRWAILLGGAADTGTRLRPVLEKRGHVVAATSRRPGRAEICWDPKDGPQPLATAIAERCGPDDRLAVINLIGGFLRDPRGAVLGSTESALAALAGSNRHLRPRYVHCSATSVYGHRPNEVLSATRSELRDDFEIGTVQREAERKVLGHPAVDGMVLRFPHIYGPGRETTFALMADGFLPVIGDGTNEMHHLHADDCAEAVARAVDLERPAARVVDVVDDGGSYGAYCDAIARAAGRPPLPRLDRKTAGESGLLGMLLGPHLDRPKILDGLWAHMTCHQTIAPKPGRDLLGFTPKHRRFEPGLAEMVRTRGVPPLTSLEAVNRLAGGIEEVVGRCMARTSLPPELASATALHPSTPLTLQTSSFEAKCARVRVSRLVSPFHSFVSVLTRPASDRAIPALQLDVVFRGNELGSAIVDLSPLGGDDRSGWLPALRAVAEAEPRAAPRPPFMAPAVSEEGLFAHGGAPNPAFVAALLRLVEDWTHRAETAPTATDPKARQDALTALIEAHRARARRSAFLPRTFGAAWAERFVPEAFFPAP
jgi:nucleoside-diphosphate-sugar epimerase